MKKLVKFPEVLFFQEGPGVRNTQYTSEGVKLLNVANLVNGQVDLSTSDRFISIHEAYGKYKNFLCDKGDFIIASSGIKVEYVDKKMGFVDGSMLPLCMNTSTIRFKVLNNKELNIRYFMYYLKSKHFKAQLGKQITGSAQLNYGPSHLKDMTLPMTDIGIQNNIVNILDKIQNIINTYETKLEKLDKLVRARFVELFGDIIINDRLWKTDTWSNLIKIVNGKNQKSVESNDGKYVICGSGGSMGRATDYLTKENSVIVGRKGNINKPILMREKYWNVDTAFGVEPNENYICVEYLYMFCLFFDFNRLNKAVTIPSLTKVDLLNISMPVPDLHIQKKFAKFVEQVDKSKVEVQRALDEAQLLFDSLMQKYFG